VSPIASVVTLKVRMSRRSRVKMMNLVRVASGALHNGKCIYCSTTLSKSSFTSKRKCYICRNNSRKQFCWSLMTHPDIRIRLRHCFSSTSTGWAFSRVKEVTGVITNIMSSRRTLQAKNLFAGLQEIPGHPSERTPKALWVKKNKGGCGRQTNKATAGILAWVLRR